MNSIIKFSLKNKLAVWLLTIIIIAAGLYSGLNMKQETIPSISTPVVLINAVYPGASPEEIAEKLTDPIESKVSSMTGLEAVSSSSMANAASIQLEFNYDTNMDKAEDEIKKQIESIELPEGAKEPEVSQLDLGAFPIVALSVTNEKNDLADLTKQVEDDLQPKLKSIDGVTSVDVSGQQVKEGKILFNEKKMAQYGLDEDTVKGIIQGSTVNLPLGLFTFTDTEKTLVVDGDVHSLQDLKNVEIPVTGAASGQSTAAQTPDAGQGADPSASAGQTGAAQTGNSQGAAGQQPIQLKKVKLSDIADIKIESSVESISRTNGKDSIGISVTKGSDADTVQIVKDVQKELDAFKEERKGIEVHTTFDQAEPIKESVKTMLSKALFGGIFAVLIILLFLRNFRSTIIAVISIPLSLLIAILILHQFDISLNVMTLGAMTVAIGRVVDDSIVVIENIYRRMALKDEKLRGAALIRSATKEMFIPILSSTVVTIAVYLPLATVTGPVGELFTPFALTMVFALLASLVVAITLVPATAHSLFRKGIKKSGHTEKPGKLAGWYKKALNWSLNHKLITFGAAILILIGSLFLVPAIGVSFISGDEEKTMIITYTPAPGEILEDVENATDDAQKYFASQDDVDSTQYTIGESMMGMGSSNSAMFYVSYKEDTENFSDVKDKVMKHLEDLKTKGEWKQQDFTSTGSSNELALNVYGKDMQQIQPIVKEVQSVLKKQKNLKDVDTSLADTYEQYTLIADQQKLSSLGLTAAQVAGALADKGTDEALTTITDDGKEVKVYIETEKETFADKKELENKTITSPFGMEVPLRELVKIEEGTSSDTISSRDGKIYADVSATIKTDDVSKVTSDVQDKIEKIDLPAGASIEFGGVTEQINESFTQLGLAMLAAIAIVYLVLVITFHGGLAPIAILFSLPFTVIGGLVALWIAGETISVSAMMGVLMLIGIVVTNAIVLIDRVIRKEEEGVSTREALLEAGSTRLRPILMTALATIGALIPLAIGSEGSGLISKGLGVTVIGGLVSSTLLTLVIVPVVYEFITKFRRKRSVEDMD